MSQEASPNAAAAEDAGWPSSIYSWFVVGILLLAYTNSFIDRQILTLLVEPIRNDFAISDTQFSVLTGLAFSATYTIAGLPFAWLSDRYSRRAVIITGITAWSIMTAACGLARSFGALFVARMGVGIGEATLSPAAYSIISDYFPMKRRANAMSVYSIGVFIGAGLALMVGGQVIQMVAQGPIVVMPLIGELRPWQLTFIYVAIPGPLIALLMLLVREPVRRGLAKTGGSAKILPYMGERWRTFVPLLLAFGLSNILPGAYAHWAPAFLMRSHHMDAATAGLVLGLMFLVGSTAGVILSGKLVERLLASGRKDSPIAAQILAVVLCIPFAVLTPLVEGRWAIVLLGGLCFVFGLMHALPVVSVQLVVPNQLRARAAAVYFLVSNFIAVGLGPVIVAMVSDYLLKDSAKIGLALAIVSVLAGTVSLLLFAITLGPYRRCAGEADTWVDASGGSASTGAIRA